MQFYQRFYHKYVNFTSVKWAQERYVINDIYCWNNSGLSPIILDIERNKVYEKPAFEATACASDRFFNPHYQVMNVYTRNSDLPAKSESFSDLPLLKIIP
jgi:hypothetical protein